MTYGLALILCAALDGVRLADGVGSLLREIRSHAGSVTDTTVIK